MKKVLTRRRRRYRILQSTKVWCKMFLLPVYTHWEWVMDAPSWRYYVRQRRPNMLQQYLTKDHVKSVYSREELLAVQTKGQPHGGRTPLCHRGQKNCWKSVGWIPTDLNPSQVWLYALKGARDLRETAQHYAGLPFWILIEFPPLCRPFSFLRIWFLVLFFLLFGLFFLRILYTFVYDNYYKSISYSSYT